MKITMQHSTKLDQRDDAKAVGSLAGWRKFVRTSKKPTQGKSKRK